MGRGDRGQCKLERHHGNHQQAGKKVVRYEGEESNRSSQMTDAELYEESIRDRDIQIKQLKKLLAKAKPIESCYTPEQRQEIGDSAKGKTIQSMQWDEEGSYWIITFTDNSEICVRLMAELV